MKTGLKEAIDAEMSVARHLCQAGKWDDAFRHLETAHILGQQYVLPHVQCHWLMLKIGVCRRSGMEIIGQGARIVLGALGSAIGIVPTGNTGGTNISMFKRLTVPLNLAKLIEGP